VDVLKVVIVYLIVEHMTNHVGEEDIGTALQVDILCVFVQLNVLTNKLNKK
jgi:hypothetical protein